MTDAVGHIAQQKLFPPRHAQVADHENVDRLLLGGAHDRQRRIGIDHDERMTALPSELLRVSGELITGCRCTRALGRSELRGSGVLRHDYLDHEKFRNVPFGKQCSPLDRLLG